MLAPAVILQVGKRVGLATPLLRMQLTRMLSQKTKERAFRGYAPTEHDVFVATFAKSGTNWMMQIAQQIAHRGRAEFGHIHEVVPWPDAPGHAAGVVALNDPGPLERSPTGLRVIKTQLEAQYVPYDEKAAYLTVLRDPKEVLVSAYYFLCGIFDVLDRVSMDAWFDLFLQGPLEDAWAAHTASYWAWRNRPNVLVLGYGEVQEDPGGCIERVARLMGVALTQGEMAAVVERSRFDYMHRHESQFAPPKLPLARGTARMIRKGRAGGGDELLSPAQQAEIDRTCLASLQRIGSDFPYARMFPSPAAA